MALRLYMMVHPFQPGCLAARGAAELVSLFGVCGRKCKGRGWVCDRGMEGDQGKWDSPPRTGAGTEILI